MIAQIYENEPKIAFELFVHYLKKKKNHQSKECTSSFVMNSQIKPKNMAQIYTLSCVCRCRLFFSKCIGKKNPAAHLATHSYSFSSHFKNHPVTAGLVLSQDLTAEANRNKFRLCCICGAQEEFMEPCRPVQMPFSFHIL